MMGSKQELVTVSGLEVQAVVLGEAVLAMAVAVTQTVAGFATYCARSVGLGKDLQDWHERNELHDPVDRSAGRNRELKRLLFGSLQLYELRRGLARMLGDVGRWLWLQRHLGRLVRRGRVLGMTSGAEERQLNERGDDGTLRMCRYMPEVRRCAERSRRLGGRPWGGRDGDGDGLSVTNSLFLSRSLARSRSCGRKVCP